MKKTVINLDTLPIPEDAFSRAMELEFETGRTKVLIISGTSSVGPNRETMYPDDFEAQVRHTYKNIKDLLRNRDFVVGDVIRWRIYLKDITGYYDRFNKIRAEFFKQNKIDKENAAPSSCIEAKICREELLVEIEAIAIKEV